MPDGEGREGVVAAIAFVDYRVLLLVEATVVAGAGAWLLTRREQAVAAPH